MTTENKIKMIEPDGGYKDVVVFLKNKEENLADYRVVHALSYAGDETGFRLQGVDDAYVVPTEIAKQVERVVYLDHNTLLSFEDKNGHVYWTSPNFHYKKGQKVTAFSVEDLAFYWDELF